MANSRSARKRIRANERKHLRNRGVRSAVRTYVTKARRALLGTDEEPGEDRVLAAIRALDRAAEKGVLHRRNAARRKSRLMTMANKLTVAAEGGDRAAARAAAAGGQKGRGTRGRAQTAKAAAAKKAASTGKRPATGRAATAARAAAAKPSTTTTAPATTTKKAKTSTTTSKTPTKSTSRTKKS